MFYGGTARFMSMGGAFTALGGDISTLSQNPAGIGVFRTSEMMSNLRAALTIFARFTRHHPGNYDRIHLNIN